MAPKPTPVNSKLKAKMKAADAQSQAQSNTDTPTVSLQKPPSSKTNLPSSQTKAPPSATRPSLDRAKRTTHVLQDIGHDKKTQAQRSETARVREKEKADEVQRKKTVEDERNQRVGEKEKELGALEDVKIRQMRAQMQVSDAEEDAERDEDVASSDDEGEESEQESQRRPTARAEPKKRPKQSQKEKKQAAVKAHRDAVALHRTEPNLATVSLQKRPATRQPAAKPPSKKSRTSTTPLTALEGFDSNWDRSRATKSAQKTSRSTKSSKSSKKTKNKKPISDSDGSDIENDAVLEKGFEDGDVVTKRGDGEANKGKRKLVAVEKPDLPSKTKSRKSKSSAPEGESIAVESLPDFIKRVYHPTLRPTMLAWAGSLPISWDIDCGPAKRFLTILRDVLEGTLEEDDYFEVKTSDAVYKALRQAIYDWRADHGKNAIKIITTSIFKKFAPVDNQKKAKEMLARKKDEIADWVAEATDDGGVAWWAQPGEPGECEGAYMSDYILETFALSHLAQVQGSCRDFSPSYGSIAMTLAAVDRGFEAWATGEFIAPDQFSFAEYGDSTEDFLDDSVFPHFRDAEDGTEKFNDFIQAAWAFIPDGNQKVRRGKSLRKSRQKRAPIVEIRKPTTNHERKGKEQEDEQPMEVDGDSGKESGEDADTDVRSDGDAVTGDYEDGKAADAGSGEAHGQMGADEGNGGMEVDVEAAVGATVEGPLNSSDNRSESDGTAAAAHGGMDVDVDVDVGTGAGVRVDSAAGADGGSAGAGANVANRAFQEQFMNMMMHAFAAGSAPTDSAAEDGMPPLSQD